MLTTGVRTPIGIKVYGADLNEVQRIATEIEGVLPQIQGTRNVFAERTGGGYFIDFDWNRKEIARYGLSINDVQEVVMSAIGGENVTTTVEGRERYPVNVRYFRDFRSDLNKLGRVLVPVMNGGMNGQTQVPVSQLADIKLVSGPSMIRDATKTPWLKRLMSMAYVAGRDVGSMLEKPIKWSWRKSSCPPA